MIGSPVDCFRARNLDPTRALNWTAGASSLSRATWPSFLSSRVDTQVITIGAPASSTESARLSREKLTEARVPFCGTPSLRLLACYLVGYSPVLGHVAQIGYVYQLFKRNRLSQDYESKRFSCQDARMGLGAPRVGR